MARKKNGGAKRQRNSNASTSWGKTIQDWFSAFSQTMAWVTGRPGTFLLAISFIVLWAVTGPIFAFSDTWQLVINTSTTIVTFLMVFLIQNTQYRDTMALQLKLAEVILAMKGVPDQFATIEDLSDDELEALHDKCRKQAETTLDHLNRRKKKS
jgi:low affinity Fe/Cu permease